MSGYSIKITSIVEELDSAGLATSDERSEECAPCTVEKTGDTLSVSFTEVSEGGQASATVTLLDGCLTVHRCGAIESTLTFREGESYKTLYKIPPYAFDMTVTTKRLAVNMTEEGGEVSVLYLMSIGGADKRVRMRITLSRGDA